MHPAGAPAPTSRTEPSPSILGLPRTGQWRLPSGREIRVRGPECWTGDETCILLELDDTVCVVVDPEPDDGLVSLALFWRDAVSPPGSRPYNCQASVLFDADASEIPFAIAPAPAGEHGECCPGSDEEQTAFRTAVRPADLGAVVDRLAGLPRRAYRPLGTGLALWRGAWTPDRRAAVELVTDALLRGEDRDRLPEHGPSTARVVDLGLA